MVVWLFDCEVDLVDFEVFYFGGYFVDGCELCDVVCCVSGDMKVWLGCFFWWLVMLVVLFVVILCELCKMCYLWCILIVLDDCKLVGFFGDDCYMLLE